jgi:hypothetical protein
MTAIKTAKPQALTKISVHFFAPMYLDFDQQMEEALLRRDAFLDRVISREVEHIHSDLEGKVNSPNANRYIAGKLKSLGGRNAPPLRQVSIAVRHSTADALRKVVEEHNLVRDALINWIVTLLRSSDQLLKSLDLPNTVNASLRYGTQDMPSSPIKAIMETQWDPFHYLRSSCQARHDCGLYSLPLPEQLHGFSCYLPDEEVPKTAAHKEKLAKEAELMKDWLDFETGLPLVQTKS